MTRRLLANRDQLVVTDMVLGETHAYFCRSPLRALQILDDFENNRAIHCEPARPSDQQEAIQLLRRDRDKAGPFVTRFHLWSCAAWAFGERRRRTIISANSANLK